ncbi:tetratricopeptide repeat protein [Chitinilyticum piscinae]|uniref:Tetratricopeptide repeat protein n=1 Tax=Chitinilyticum piscinae TaxID=2866724 RepID=A0A8J7FMR9_9NEIS|nr:tetratricopeptide repeat protein [Chitinilyticum piscinae]MBE9609029.1 tetratricopeptide repeat protein [Chitinilyticum piscinae]
MSQPATSDAHAARLHAIDAILFTRPAAARDACVALLTHVRGHDHAAFVQTALKLSYIEDQLGETGQALTLLEEALALLAPHGLAAWEAEVLEQIGRCNYTRGHYPQALAAWEKSVRLAADAPDLQGCKARALLGLGQICDAFGQPARAVELHQLADRVAQLLDDPFVLAAIRINLGTNLIRLARFAEAGTCLDSALALCRQHGFPHHEAETLWRQAELLLHAGEPPEAAQLLLERALDILLDTPYHWGEVNVLGTLAEVQFRQNLLPQALDTIQRALLIARSDGLRQLEARLTAQAATYALLSGRPEQAELFRQRSSLLQGRIEQEARQHRVLMLADELGREFLAREARLAGC